MRIRLAGGGGNLLQSGVTVNLPSGVQIQFVRGYDGNGSPGFYADAPPGIAIALQNTFGAVAVGGDARPLDARLSTTNQYPQVTPAVPASATATPVPLPASQLLMDETGFRITTSDSFLPITIDP